MQYRIREKFSKKKGVISNNHGFLQTYLDGGFKEKWSGYWSPSHKYLDYFAIKINGVWLTEDTLQEAKYGETIVNHHRVSALEVRQEIECPDQLPGFKIKYQIKNLSNENKAVRLSMEAGIDIRERSKDIESQNYRIETNEKEIRAVKDDKWLSISGEKFNFKEESYIKEHFPGERQKCLIPGKVFSQCEIGPKGVKDREIVLETDGTTGNSVSTEGSLKHQELGRTFNYSLKSLENLYYDKNNSGIIAGHPWFQNYWARDSFWTSLGMIDAGMFEEVEKLLLNFAERNKFPSKIHTAGGSETDYPRSDSIPLFAIAVDELNHYYDANEKLLNRAEDLLKENRPRGKIVDHDPEGTWMDTLNRENAVDIQSLWIESLDRFDKGTKRLKKGLGEFKEEEYMKDNLKDDFESINCALTLMFGQLEENEAQNYLEKINGEFSSRYGARTRSVTDPGYNCEGYHTGSAWGLTTCWAAGANLKYGQDDHGINFLKKLTQFIDRNQMGALPEVVDAESGKSLGCDEQAWSAGLFVHIIDSYLLGINIKNNKLIIDPIENISLIRTAKRIRNERIDIKVNNGEVEILNEPEIEIEIK